jgi:hypothetical protein
MLNYGKLRDLEPTLPKRPFYEALSGTGPRELVRIKAILSDAIEIAHWTSIASLDMS